MPPTTTPKLGKPRAKPKKDPDLVAVRLTLGEHGSHTLQRDWTARVAERCRREMGCTPEAIFEELAGISGSKADRASIDTAVRLFCLAAWQNGAQDVTYDGLLDVVKVSTPFTMDADYAEEHSPEA